MVGLLVEGWVCVWSANAPVRGSPEEVTLDLLGAPDQGAFPHGLDEVGAEGLEQPDHLRTSSQTTP
jgi:hypothetical protein